jgi:hypothetical protein
MISPDKYLLLDANVLAGYYAPQSFNCRSRPAEDWIRPLIEAVRTGCAPHIRLFTPEICVSEAQTVLSKHTNTRWKGGRRKKDDGQAIHRRTYSRLIRQMRSDLHGGSVIESIPLARYHVLAKQLITPIDHGLHLKQKDKKKPVNEMGGTDQLICGMALWLTRLLGRERVSVLTADWRLYKVLAKASTLSVAQVRKLGIQQLAEQDIGFKWSNDFFPRVVYLPRASDKLMRDACGSWPLPTKPYRPTSSRVRLNRKGAEKLRELYKAMGIARDRLPYTAHMRRLVEQFNTVTGQRITEQEAWSFLVAMLKQGNGRLQRN